MYGLAPEKPLLLAPGHFLRGVYRNFYLAIPRLLTNVSEVNILKYLFGLPFRGFGL